MTLLELMRAEALRLQCWKIALGETLLVISGRCSQGLAQSPMRMMATPVSDHRAQEHSSHGMIQAFTLLIMMRDEKGEGSGILEVHQMCQGR